MTMWIPELKRAEGPVYREIANALARDIAEGRLSPGTRLPTHRDLAWHLKVTVGTVSRAYAEAERRGLIGGAVGRGTFVLPSATPPRPGDGGEPAGGFIDLSLNYALTGDEPHLLAATLSELAESDRVGSFLRYGPHLGAAADRAAGATWCRAAGLADGEADRIAVTNGGQHAIALLLGLLTRPGDAVAVEQLTYSGLKTAAQQAGVHPVGVAMDEAGLLPEALDAACRTRAIRVLYTMPTLHNPTTATMPEARRHEIAAVCRRHDIAVIEDDVYGFLCGPPLPPLSSLLPERGYFLTSLSKAFAPGLRIGYIHAPRREMDRLGTAIRAATYMAPPLTAAVATRWIESGSGDRLLAAKRRVAALRQPLAAAAFGDARLGTRLVTDPAAWHCWLHLPEGWRAEEFAAAARHNGVGVTPATAFAAGPGPLPEAVRFCLGPPATSEILERALHTLADTLGAGRSPYLSVV